MTQRHRGSRPGGPASWMPRDARGRLMAWDSDHVNDDGTLDRTCIRCGVRYPLDAGFSYHPNARKQRQTICKECVRIAARRTLRELTVRAIDALGGPTCATCGFADPRALEIDHVVTVASLKLTRPQRFEFLRSIVFDGQTDNLQVLCANCHAIKTHGETKARVAARELP